MDGECNDLEILTELTGFGNPSGGHQDGRSEERLANTRTANASALSPWLGLIKIVLPIPFYFQCARIEE